jgi:hypothetical protein
VVQNGGLVGVRRWGWDWTIEEEDAEEKEYSFDSNGIEMPKEEVSPSSVPPISRAPAVLSQAGAKSVKQCTPECRLALNTRLSVPTENPATLPSGGRSQLTHLPRLCLVPASPVLSAQLDPQPF